ncbi:hypothetical protein JL722_8450 [Aureococcus anophagefferens]|nr:hypothetical protein JL722_8450 [Aureococcus anophagefferens]
MEERKSPERDDCARVSGELRSGCWQVCGQGVVMVLGLWLGWGLLSAGVAFKLRNDLADDDATAWEAARCRTYAETVRSFERTVSSYDEAGERTVRETWCYDFFAYNFTAAEERHAVERFDGVTRKRCGDCACASTSAPAGPRPSAPSAASPRSPRRANGTACADADCYRLFPEGDAGDGADRRDWLPFVVAGAALCFGAGVVCCASAGRQALANGGGVLPITDSLLLPRPKADGGGAPLYRTACGDAAAAPYQRALLAAGVGGGLLVGAGATLGGPAAARRQRASPSRRCCTTPRRPAGRTLLAHRRDGRPRRPPAAVARVRRAPEPRAGRRRAAAIAAQLPKGKLWTRLADWARRDAALYDAAERRRALAYSAPLAALATAAVHAYAAAALVPLAVAAAACYDRRAAAAERRATTALVDDWAPKFEGRGLRLRWKRRGPAPRHGWLEIAPVGVADDAAGCVVYPPGSGVAVV